jgi:hypothetical protein
MKIPIGKTGNKQVSFDLDILLSTRLLIQANSGAGKSYLLRKLMEEMFGHVQVIAIDPEGEFATLREKFDYVLVGKGGETPAHISTAEELAPKLLELRASAVCDLYEMPARERHTWTHKFLSALINAPKKLWHPLIIVVDEAHIFCPEKGAGESEASDAMIDLATRGRKRGFCAVFATQRLGKLRKDAAAELQNVMIGGTFLDVDVKRAAETLGIPKGKDERDFAAHMKVVAPGTFIALGRAISKERLELRVGEVQTSHPKPGSAKHAAEPPAPSAKVRELLTKLAELPQIAEEKARTMEDLQKKVRELQGQLVQAKRTQPAATAKVKEAKIVDSRLILQAVKRRDQEWAKAARAHQTKIHVAIGDALKGAVAAGSLRLEAPQLPVIDETPTPAHEVRTAAAADLPARVAVVDHSSNGDLSSAQVRILAALAEAEALGRAMVNRSFLAALASVSASSGGFRNNLGRLRSLALIDYPMPEFVAMTENGRGKAPQVDPPASAEEMLGRCKAFFSSSQAAILDALAKAFPEAMEREELATAVDVSETSGGFRNNLGALRTAGMIDYPGQGQVKISNWVMLED